MANEALQPTKPEHLEVFQPPEGAVDFSRRNRPRRSRGIVYWLIALLVLGLISLPVGLWVRHQQLYVTTTNAIVRGHLAQLGSRLSAVVADVHVENGDRVAKGDVLVTLIDQHLRAKAEGARAELAKLQRDLEVERREINHERLLLPERDREGLANLAAAQAEVDEARIRSDEAREHHRVQVTLHENQIVSAEVVREAKAEWDTQLAILEASKARLAALRASENRRRIADQALEIREFRVGALEERIELARANLHLAEADLASTKIRAPENGAIVRRIVQPGASIEAGLPTIIMQLGDDLWVEAWVNETDVGFVNPGNEAIVTFASFPGEKFRARVESIGSSSDYEIPETEVPQPRYARMQSAPVVNVRLVLDAPPEKLRPGLSAVVAIKK